MKKSYVLAKQLLRSAEGLLHQPVQAEELVALARKLIVVSSEVENAKEKGRKLFDRVVRVNKNYSEETVEELDGLVTVSDGVYEIPVCTVDELVNKYFVVDPSEANDPHAVMYQVNMVLEHYGNYSDYDDAYGIDFKLGKNGKVLMMRTAKFKVIDQQLAAEDIMHPEHRHSHDTDIDRDQDMEKDIQLFPRGEY